MSLRVLSISIFVCLHLSVYGQRKYKYFDGPYIEQIGDTLDIKWVEKGEKKQMLLPSGHDIVFDVDGLPKVNLGDLSIIAQDKFNFKDVKKIVAISDIHGQHDLFVKLMQAHELIDSTQNWIFGDGHLMVVGDVFDRGDKVTESLWLLFQLEKQAEKMGGKVHLLLGNHELLVLHGNLNYLNPKYFYTSAAFKTYYPKLYAENTVLGKWLRSKNVTVKINDIVFVHGGFSQEMLQKESALGKLNKIFRNDILVDSKSKNDDELLSLLYFENGPLWYRGYANPNGFDIEQTENILEKLDAKTIVVGHTSMPRIVSLHENKIFLIDSSIKFGKTGEVLIVEHGKYYRGLADGSIDLIEGENRNKYGRSPFQYVYDLGNSDLLIEINTDINKLIKNKSKEKNQKASLTAYYNEEYNREWHIKLRARGKMRKEFCHLPPIKIDFSKSTLEYLGFSKNDKLKVVLPCDDTKPYHQGLYREYLVYKLYSVLDPNALHTRLANFRFTHKHKIKYELKGFLVEDEENYADRLDAVFDKSEKSSNIKLNREHYIKLAMFQYMIRNTDWSITNAHNIELVNLPGIEGLLAIPYDFDYAGIVGQDYAKAKTDTPVEILDDAYLILQDLTQSELTYLKDFFIEKKEKLLSVISSADYLDEFSSTRMTATMESFYEALEDEHKWVKYFHLK